VDGANLHQFIKGLKEFVAQQIIFWQIPTSENTADQLVTM
jgi:hypothetical protein